MPTFSHMPISLLMLHTLQHLTLTCLVCSQQYGQHCQTFTSMRCMSSCEPSLSFYVLSWIKPSFTGQHQNEAAPYVQLNKAILGSQEGHL